MKHYTTRLFLLASLLASSLAGADALSEAWTDSYALESAAKYDQASAAMSLILRDSPSHEFALMRRAWLGYLQGHHNDALHDYQQALAVNPKSLEARLGLTLPLMAQQRWREAAVEARKVIASSAWDYTAHTRMMTCEEALHQWPELAQHATEVAAHFPSDATVLLYLARAEAWQGNISAAKKAYEKVLQRIPAHLEATTYLANNP